MNLWESLLEYARSRQDEALGTRLSGDLWKRTRDQHLMIEGLCQQVESLQQQINQLKERKDG